MSRSSFTRAASAAALLACTGLTLAQVPAPPPAGAQVPAPAPLAAPPPVAAPAPIPPPATAAAPAAASPAATAPAAAPAATAALPPIDLFRDKELVAAFAAIPVQESGRIKPLATTAAGRLKVLRGMESLWLTDNGDSDGKPLVDPATQKPVLNAKGKPVKLSAVEWLLVSWFRPDFARNVPLITVDNSAAIAELGLPTKGLRDQYSINEIEPARALLVKKRGEYAGIAKPTAEQRILVQLYANFLDADMICGHFDFIRAPLGDPPRSPPAGVGTPVRLSKSLPLIVEAIKAVPQQEMLNIPWIQPFGTAALGAVMSGNPELQLRLFPPAAKEDEIWSGPGPMLFGAVNGSASLDPGQLAWLALYEDVYLALPDAAKFKSAAQTLLAKVQSAAQARGEAEYVPLELHSIRVDYFMYAQWLFLVGFIFVALTWVAPGSLLHALSALAAWFFLGTATVMASTGIVIRCIIMQRAPITTLFETIIFIGASCGILGLIMEALTRRGLGLLLTAVAGTACMFLAVQYRQSESADTLQQLQAVLITEFWLSTHVPMINLGYAACMLASVLSTFYVVYRLVKLRAPNASRAKPPVDPVEHARKMATAKFFGIPYWLLYIAIKTEGSSVVHTVEDTRRFITRAAYAFICVGLLLALVGTVLGGIWANYSWGRFWGWDPKENGALMIVLMCLVILHARMGGYIREAGLHCCSLILGCIVIFSWFGVNQLGVGLHAYGFTDGTWPKIYTFWGGQGLLLLAGLFLSFKDRHDRKKAASAGSTEEPGSGTVPA